MGAAASLLRRQNRQDAGALDEDGQSHADVAQGQAATGDEQRAQRIVAAARSVVAHYSDVNAALRDGYKPFHPTGKLGEEVHYTNYRYNRLEQRHVNYDHPGSILYQRTPEGMQAVGVMYTATQDSTPEHLNAVAPLSIATWHRHVDFCGGARTCLSKSKWGRTRSLAPKHGAEWTCRWTPIPMTMQSHDSEPRA